MLLATEAFFLNRCNDLAVAQQAGGAVMIKRGDSKNVHRHSSSRWQFDYCFLPSSWKVTFEQTGSVEFRLRFIVETVTRIVSTIGIVRPVGRRLGIPVV